MWSNIVLFDISIRHFVTYRDATESWTTKQPFSGVQTITNYVILSIYRTAKIAPCSQYVNTTFICI